MALPSTGQLSLSQVNTELGRPAAQAIAMNDTEVRELAGKPSGAISFADLRGKAWWVLQTGYKWLMTSNTAPAPFIVSGNTAWYSGGDLSGLWVAFNTSGSDIFYSRSDGAWAYAWIDVGTNLIKPKTFYINSNLGYTACSRTIDASVDGVTWDNLYTGLNMGAFTGNIAVNATKGYRYFRYGLKGNGGGLTQSRTYSFLLTEWYAK